MQRVDPPHDRKLSRRRRPRFVIEAAAAQPQQFRLPRQRQVMASVDHRLALSRPALLSAPDKKSFSKVSSPILAWRVFRSTDGVASVTAPPEPNSPEAASTRCPFQAVIWFGCTSYCCANSASVFSPLMAASATFALKAGAWVRRDRSVMVVPDPRHPRRSQAEIPLIGLSEFGRPPLCCNQHHPVRAAVGVREPLLCPRRGGESDQAAQEPTRVRSHQLPLPAGQPDAAVSPHRCLLADVGCA